LTKTYFKCAFVAIHKAAENVESTPPAGLAAGDREENICFFA